MKQHGPWQIKSSIEKYKNPWITVREDQVIRPDGSDGIFGVIEIVPGVSVLPLDEHGYAYLTDEFHYANGKNGLETVSGAIEYGEEPLQTAKRELLEELGIEAEEWINLGRIDPFTTTVYSPAQQYLARALRFQKARPEGTENITMIKISLEEAKKKVMTSAITHGPSALLILKTAAYLKS